MGLSGTIDFYKWPVHWLITRSSMVTFLDNPVADTVRRKLRVIRPHKNVLGLRVDLSVKDVPVNFFFFLVLLKRMNHSNTLSY